MLELPRDGLLSYKPFTPKAAVELVAPSTWVASLGPCCIAGAFALSCALVFSQYQNGLLEANVVTRLAVVLDARSALCWFLMLFCAVLLQSATNTLNDYQDFMSGLDTAESVLDESDASLVYNQINPRSALVFSMVLLLAAAVFGVSAALLSSAWLFLFGIIAGVAVALYSAGPKPISFLPIGELVSGVVMGGLLTSVTFYALTLAFSPIVLAVAVVPLIAIAQIMQTNNTCDIERDLAVGRKTMPGIIGTQRSRVLNAALSVAAFIWMGIVLVWAQLFFGLIVCALGFIFCLSQINRLLKGPYTLENRRVMMQTVVSYNKRIDATLVAAALLGGALSGI